MNAAFGKLGSLLRAGGSFGRGALVLSLVVHGGIAAAFVGWGEPSFTPTDLVAVAVVADPSAGEAASTATTASTPSGAPHLPATTMPPATASSTDSEPAPAQLAEAPSAPSEPGSDLLPDPATTPAPEPVTKTNDDRPVATAPPAKPAHVAAAEPAGATPPAAPIATDNAVLSDGEVPAEPDPPGSQLASLPPPAPAGDDNAVDPDPAIAREPAFEPARYDVAALGNPKPDYPYLSRSRGEQGRVVLRVEVTATGDVASIEIADSSGHRRLDEAAIDAVAQWRFEPARVGDDPIATTVNVPITFRIEN